MFPNFPLKHSSSNQIYSVHVHSVKHVTSTENNIVYFLFYSEISFETLIKERLDGAAIEGVAGVAWFDGKIFIVFFELKKLFVFSDKVPFDELKDAEKLIVDEYEMEKPFDMVASERSRALFISDTYHQCLWKINLQNMQLKFQTVTLREFKVSHRQDIHIHFRLCHQAIYSLLSSMLKKTAHGGV